MLLAVKSSHSCCPSFLRVLGCREHHALGNIFFFMEHLDRLVRRVQPATTGANRVILSVSTGRVGWVFSLLLCMSALCATELFSTPVHCP